MKRKGSEVTGMWLLNYVESSYDGIYHIADCNGRLYLCGRCKGFFILDRLGSGFGYREVFHDHIRNDSDKLDFRHKKPQMNGVRN